MPVLKMRITTPMIEQHFERLREIVVYNLKAGGITILKKGILTLELFQKIVHVVLVDEKTVRIVLISFLRHFQHLIPNEPVIAEHLPYLFPLSLIGYNRSFIPLTTLVISCSPPFDIDYVFHVNYRITKKAVLLDGLRIRMSNRQKCNSSRP